MYHWVQKENMADKNSSQTSNILPISQRKTVNQRFSPRNILTLQQTVGNHAVQRILANKVQRSDEDALEKLKYDRQVILSVSGQAGIELMERAISSLGVNSQSETYMTDGLYDELTETDETGVRGSLPLDAWQQIVAEVNTWHLSASSSAQAVIISQLEEKVANYSPDTTESDTDSATPDYKSFSDLDDALSYALEQYGVIDPIPEYDPDDEDEYDYGFDEDTVTYSHSEQIGTLGDGTIKNEQIIEAITQAGYSAAAFEAYQYDAYTSEDHKYIVTVFQSITDSVYFYPHVSSSN